VLPGRHEPEAGTDGKRYLAEGERFERGPLQMSESDDRPRATLSAAERAMLAVLLVAWAGSLVMVVSIAWLRPIPMAVLGLVTVAVAFIVYRAAIIIRGHRQ
jgi:hypothetical protein